MVRSLAVVAAVLSSSSAALALKQQQQEVRQHAAPAPEEEEEGPMKMDLATFQRRREAERQAAETSEEDEDAEQNPFDKIKKKKAATEVHVEEKKPAQCDKGEIARFHRGIATDLSAVFQHMDSFSLRFPNMTADGMLPECTLENMLTETEFKMDVLMWCTAKRLLLTYKCSTCFNIVTKVIQPQKKNGKESVAGCQASCMPMFLGCVQAFTEYDKLSDCLGSNLKVCTKCIEPAAMKLGECMGDETPFNLAGFIGMMQHSFQEESPTIIPTMVEYIQGVGLQAAVDEHHLGHHDE